MYRSEFCRLRDLNGLRLYAEEIERDQIKLDEARLERKRTNLRNWLKLARIKFGDERAWDYHIRLKLTDRHFREEDAAGRGRIRFIYENIQRVQRMYDALAARIAKDGAA